MSWRAALHQCFGARIASATPLHGGDLSEVVDVTLEDGRRLVVKQGPRTDTEARMLRVMAMAGAPVPDVLHQADGLLCLSWLDEVAPSAQAWQQTGASLARLHRTAGQGYGWTEDYGFGGVALDNAACTTWPEFWGKRRLAPFLPDLPAPLARRVDAAITSLPERLPATPHPALLHGDLWQGNLLCTPRGTYFIDPACYHGHAEVDLAMLELFGQPDPAFWQGYGACEPDRAERRPIYQLFPALVHLRLFGASYTGLVASCLDEARV